MINRVFIVEGVPCTGKTSTSEYIANLLRDSGQKVLHFPEGVEDNPSDYSFHAYVTKDQIELFTKEEKEILLSNSEQKNNGYIISLSNIQGELFNKVIKYKIYDMLPWEIEYPIMLDKWREFSELAKSNDNIYVFDCCFLQNPLCETMMRLNMQGDEIYNYVNNIYENIKELEPVVIYLKNINIKARVGEVSKERDKQWLKDVIEYHTSQGYGKSCGYFDFDGYVECLKDRQDVELTILDKLNLDKKIMENPYEDWERTYEEIKKFIHDLEL